MGRVALIILAVLLGSIIGFGYGASQGRVNYAEDNTAAFVTSLVKHSPSATALATPTATPDPTAAWKTYSITDLGATFKYPSEWADFSLVKKVNTGTDYSAGSLYTWPISSVHLSGQYLDPIIYSSDYHSIAGAVMATKVNTSWSKAEFAAARGISVNNIIYYEKLSSKALLVIEYRNNECSPGISADIYSPLTQSYPNLIMSFGENYILVSQDTDLIKSFEANVKPGEDICDKLPTYQTIGQRLSKDGFSTKAKTFITTATNIASTLTVE